MFEEQILDKIANGNWTDAIRACAAKKEVNYEFLLLNYEDFKLNAEDIAYLITNTIKEIRNDTNGW